MLTCCHVDTAGSKYLRGAGAGDDGPVEVPTEPASGHPFPRGGGDASARAASDASHEAFDDASQEYSGDAGPLDAGAESSCSTILGKGATFDVMVTPVGSCTYEAPRELWTLTLVNPVTMLFNVTREGGAVLHVTCSRGGEGWTCANTGAPGDSYTDLRFEGRCTMFAAGVTRPSVGCTGPFSAVATGVRL